MARLSLRAPDPLSYLAKWLAGDARKLQEVEAPITIGAYLEKHKPRWRMCCRRQFKRPSPRVRETPGATWLRG